MKFSTSILLLASALLVGINGAPAGSDVVARGFNDLGARADNPQLVGRDVAAAAAVEQHSAALVARGEETELQSRQLLGILKKLLRKKKRNANAGKKAARANTNPVKKATTPRPATAPANPVKANGLPRPVTPPATAPPVTNPANNPPAKVNNPPAVVPAPTVPKKNPGAVGASGAGAIAATKGNPNNLHQPAPIPAGAIAAGALLGGGGAAAVAAAKPYPGVASESTGPPPPAPKMGSNPNDLAPVPAGAIEFGALIGGALGSKPGVAPSPNTNGVPVLPLAVPLRNTE